jgi:hypothetical protein
VEELILSFSIVRLFSSFSRHGHTCCGHPRLSFLAAKKPVDGPTKSGHDEKEKCPDPASPRQRRGAQITPLSL